MKNKEMNKNISILLVGDNIIYGRSVSYLNSFKKMDCTVNLIDTRKLYKITTLNRVFNIFSRIPVYYGINLLNSEVIRSFRDIRPNLLIFIKPVFIKPETLNIIKSTGALVFSWNGDSMFFRKNISTLFLKTISIFDCHFSINSLNATALGKNGAIKSIFLPPAADLLIHKPVNVSREDRLKYSTDIVFIGSYEKYRANILAKLSKLGYDIAIYGNRWERCLRHSILRKNNCIKYKEVCGEEMSKVINSSKIVIAFLRKHNKDLQTGRTYEIPGCGGFMLHEYNDEVINVFKEGKEAEYFRTFQELVNKIDLYLKNDSLRKSIAAAGHKKVIEANYIYDERAKVILNTYEHIKK